MPPIELTSSGWVPICPTNPAPLAASDGSVALFFRGYQFGDEGSTIERLFRADATSWQGPYVATVTTPLFGRPGEDPFVWRSKDGSLRMLFNDKFTDPSAVGGFALTGGDGGTWAPAGSVYGLAVAMADGSTQIASRRERPSIAWSSDGHGAVLFTGVVPTPAYDRSYVMATPLTTGM